MIIVRHRFVFDCRDELVSQRREIFPFTELQFDEVHERCFHAAAHGAAVANAMGAKSPALTIPYGLMNFAAASCEWLCKPLGIQPPLHRRRLTFFKHNRTFSTGKARRLLGCEPKADLDEGFRRTVAWYREHGLLSPHSSI